MVIKEEIEEIICISASLFALWTARFESDGSKEVQPVDSIIDAPKPKRMLSKLFI